MSIDRCREIDDDQRQDQRDQMLHDSQEYTPDALEHAAQNATDSGLTAYIQDDLINEDLIVDLISNALITGKPVMIDKAMMDLINKRAIEYVKAGNL